MPIYEYKCKECGSLHEKLLGRPETESKCPECNETAERIFSVSNFKINGFSEANGYSNCKRR